MSLRTEEYTEGSKGAAKKFPTTAEAPQNVPIPPKHLFHSEQPGRPRDSVTRSCLRLALTRLRPATCSCSHSFHSGRPAPRRPGARRDGAERDPLRPGGTGPGRGAPLRGAERRGPRVSGSTWRGRPGSWGPASSVEGPRRQRSPAGWHLVHHASLPVPPCLQPGPGPRLRPPRWGLCFTRPHRVGPTSSPRSRGPNPLTPRKTPAWMFSRIRFGVTDLGMTITFLWM